MTSRCWRSWVVLAAALAAVPACKKKPASQAAPAAITGLGAVPADATVVVSFDIGRLFDSQLVGRAVDLLLQREDGLRAQWGQVADACKLDVKTQVHRVLFALGPAVDKVGQPVLMVVSGTLAEATIATCVRTAVGSGGGELSARTSNGGTLYTVKEGSRVVWFGFGQADTVVLGSSEAWVEQALAPGKKLSDSGDLRPLIARADQAAPIWAVGIPSARIGDGLIKLSGGKLKQGPTAMFASVDPTAGLRFEIGADLATEDEAKFLEDFANAQLPLLALEAQVKALGPLVAKITATRAKSTVRIGASLSMDEVNQLIHVIDTPGEDPQDSALPPGAGASTPDAVPSGKSK